MRNTVAIALLALTPALGQVSNLRTQPSTGARQVQVFGGLGIKDGGYQPQYAPKNKQHKEMVQQTAGYSSWSAPSYAPAPAPVSSWDSSSAATSGFSPEQLEFLRRKQEETGGSSPQTLAHLERSWDSGSSGASYGGSYGSKTAGYTFAKAYAPQFAPSYHDPRLDALPESTGSSLVAALVGLVAGFGVTFYIVVQRRRSTAIAQPLLI